VDDVVQFPEGDNKPLLVDGVMVFPDSEVRACAAPARLGDGPLLAYRLHPLLVDCLTGSSFGC
jgi:hypothetical protein